MDTYIYKRGGAEKPEARMAVNNSGWKGGGEEQTGTDEVGRCGEDAESVEVDGVDRRLRRAAGGGKAVYRIHRQVSARLRSRNPHLRSRRCEARPSVLVSAVTCRTPSCRKAQAHKASTASHM